MSFVQTSFKIGSKSKISSFISGKEFGSDEEFIDAIEDYLFGKDIQKADKSDSFIGK